MKRLLLAGLLAVTAGPLARAVDVSGTYENLGAVVASPQGTPGGAASLRGLVDLEFDLELAALLHSSTSRVSFEQEADRFTMHCWDAEGAEIWRGRWPRGVGYGVEGEQVKLVVRSARYPNDGFLFVLTSVSDQKRLLVDVVRINSGLFGSTGKSLGTFLFNRPVGKTSTGQ